MSSAGLSAAAHAPHRADEIGQPLEREVLAVQRDEHRVGGDQRVEREQSERRRTVDEDVVELRASGSSTRWSRCSRSGIGTSSISAPVRLRSAGMTHRFSTWSGAERQSGRRVGHQRFVDGPGFRRLPFEPDAACEIALRIDVDQQHPTAGERDRGGQVDGGGGLSDAALLIGDGDDASEPVLSLRRDVSVI